MFAERILYSVSNENHRSPIPVRIHAPVRDDSSWACTYEIGWPEKRRRMTIHGVDAIQALILALKAVGSEIHISRHHVEGRLVWEKAGEGYGFPIADGLRDLLADADL
jgi:hypothetical protein